MRIALIDKLHPVFNELVEAAGHEIVDHTRAIPAALPELLSTIDGIAMRSRISIDEEFLDANPSLKFIARSGAGLEHIDIDACERKGVVVFASPEGNRVAVGEHALGMLLGIMNKLQSANSSVREGLWNREAHRGYEIAGKTVGIIGYGRMGTAFAQRLQGFDCKVLAYDKYRTNYGDNFAREASLEELHEQAEILSIHTPLTDETDGMVNQAFILSFKKPFWFINTARGKIVHTADLLNALDDELVLGACLDVLEFESSSFQQLSATNPVLNRARKHAKIIFSPHVAGWTVESKRKLGEVLAQKIINYAENG